MNLDEAQRQIGISLQEMGGAVFVVVALTPYGGWHKEAKSSGNLYQHFDRLYFMNQDTSNRV